MKILYVLPYYPFSLRSGSSVRASNIIRRMVKRHDVHIVCLGLGHKMDPSMADVADSCASITVIPHEFSRIKSALKSLFTLTPYDLVIHRNSKFADQVHSRITELMPGCAYFSRFGVAPYALQNAPVIQVLDQHDLSHAFWDKASRGAEKAWFRAFARISKQLSIRAERKLYRRFDGVISVSDSEMQDTRQFLSDLTDTLTIPNGADTDYYRPAESDGENGSIVFTGAMNAQRNVDAVARFAQTIFPRILEQYASARLQIVGHSPTAAIRRLAEAPNIEVTGEVDDIRPFLSKATVVIAPFWSGSGVKHKVPIAMSMGKALVLTSNACQGLSITHGREALIANSDEDFATQVTLILKDEALRKELGARARKFIEEEYSWDSLASRLDQWLVRLSKSRHSRKIRPQAS